MKLLKDKILSAGNLIGEDVIKVDNFLNHQIDIELFNEMGKEFQKRFRNKEINKILTVEASGIGIACIVAQYFNNCPVVFAKKHEAVNMDMDTYESEVYSFTKKKSYKVRVTKKIINEGDKILIIDDFLANGQAVLGLVDIVKQGSGEVAGVGIAIEKSFQEGRRKIEDIGIQIESLARIKGFKNNTIIFYE